MAAEITGVDKVGIYHGTRHIRTYVYRGCRDRGPRVVSKAVAAPSRMNNRLS